MEGHDHLKGKPLISAAGSRVENTRLPPMCPGSLVRRGVICGLSLLLALYTSQRGFSQGTRVFPSPQKPAFPNSDPGMHRYF